ncbi:hypothetical protein CU044_4981 [Streptomyces sp. L-9-10]|uniref:hypothetical protein n=1 Tax=Streptomyces sp. L-9-10 TaxID=1478131 RepID=UPI0010EBD6DA|nr:hypothetical protein [Streptomyces sp. L-9-10]RYJ24133.1 hypothetical protein CU044_4981 [Streptomyces sp. L-9-10]
MGSLRNPVGPLPSTIYWRRRAVAATLIALLALLVVWVVSSRGGDGKNSGDTADGANPATSITPGPSGSGPAISEQPGGRDESGSTNGTGGTGGTGGGGDGGKNGDTGGGGGAGSGGTDGAADTGGASGGGSAGSGGGSTSSGRQVPAGSGLPNCPPSALTLRLTTTKVAYAPGEKPEFRLTATNTSNTACKADFGPKAVVLTIADADDEDVWSSEHCPKTGGVLYEVPAGGAITRTIEWNRGRSAPGCATPPARAVGPGTYLVEAKTSRASVKQGQASIRLEKD